LKGETTLGLGAIFKIKEEEGMIRALGRNSLQRRGRKEQHPIWRNKHPVNPLERGVHTLIAPSEKVTMKVELKQLYAI
jgi:hypothetical protein